MLGVLVCAQRLPCKQDRGRASELHVEGAANAGGMGEWA